jgi:hypothetical protein
MRSALDRHWAASDVKDFETEHSIYHEDALLEYPQSGELIRGRCKHTNYTHQTAERKALCCAANHWSRRSLGHRIHPDV